MENNRKNKYMNIKDYIGLTTNIYHGDHNHIMGPEGKIEFEKSLMSFGWVKLESGLYADMSEKNDCYGKLLKHRSLKKQCNLHSID